MRKLGIHPRGWVWLLLLVLVAGGTAALSIGTSNSTTALAKSASFDAEGVLSPVNPAPPLELHNYLGKPVNIASYRGKAVLVTFLYTNCPDICPLITSDLRVALNLMSRSEASKVQIIAVSVDPKGDTPKAVAAFLARHGMTGRMQYLIGSAKELAGVWQAWGVGSERDAEQPQLVNHTGLVYGITGSGDRLTVYSPSFRPEQIAHDVPLLAAR
jgi:protein SCO1/2